MGFETAIMVTLTAKWGKFGCPAVQLSVLKLFFSHALDYFTGISISFERLLYAKNQAVVEGRKVLNAREGGWVTYYSWTLG